MMKTSMSAGMPAVCYVVISKFVIVILFFDVSIMCLLLKRKFVDYSSSESEMKTEILAVRVVSFNPLIPTLKLQSNGHYTAMR